VLIDLQTLALLRIIWIWLFWRFLQWASEALVWLYS